VQNSTYSHFLLFSNKHKQDKRTDRQTDKQRGRETKRDRQTQRGCPQIESRHIAILRRRAVQVLRFSRLCAKFDKV